MNARNNRGRTALHKASNRSRAEAMRELLKRHDVDINARDGDGNTPLINACTQGHLMAATILIGADLALLNNSGHSALFRAEQRVQQDALAPLAAPAAPPVARAAAPRAVFTRAQRAEHKALVAMLKGHGAR